ncbi:phosphatidylserine decarboxylase proenzyme 3 [Aspergillus udagawae]|uniref:Phosphatidylserine decarboxylase proenzyme 3 n=1 Tax=Aspergillus udagawae TaxID=91492 RepID=A0A8H3NLL7_9EURO|nr:phosphatidylserine decarboxylase proenzyme 3 [Aspergillus udagawae]
MASTAVQLPLRDPWSSKDFGAIYQWRANAIKEAAVRPVSSLDPTVERFLNLLDNKSLGLGDLANKMLSEIPPTPTYDYDPSGKFGRMTDYKHMVQCINRILYTAPRWDHDEYKVGLIGVPFNALFNWPMATESGFQFFKDSKVNGCLRNILTAHGDYLKSPKSQSALLSWFEEEPLKLMTEKASPYWPDGRNKKFEEIYVCNPADKTGCWGFNSWDDFFIREFCKGVRPVARPDSNHDPDESSKAVITNACESVVYRCQKDVQKRDKFWLKGQPYSLVDMLNFDENVDAFVGGTVYQAWLAAECYHRWHSPVTGTVKKIVPVPGTYFSGLREYGFPEVSGNRNIPDPSGPNLSQRYITAVATRTIIFIEADNPTIGLMCFIAVGMDEISSCEVTVNEGDQVMKGDQLGTFHLGGSTHCLIFRPGVHLDWARDAQPPYSDTEFDKHTIIPVNSWLASKAPARITLIERSIR